MEGEGKLLLIFYKWLECIIDSKRPKKQAVKKTSQPQVATVFTPSIVDYADVFKTSNFEKNNAMIDEFCDKPKVNIVKAESDIDVNRDKEIRELDEQINILLSQV